MSSLDCALTGVPQGEYLKSAYSAGESITAHLPKIEISHNLEENKIKVYILYRIVSSLIRNLGQVAVVGRGRSSFAVEVS